MHTLNTIYEDIKNIPLSKLEELQMYINSLISSTSIKETNVKNQLADWQINLIEEGIKDIKEGNVITHEDFLKSYGR